MEQPTGQDGRATRPSAFQAPRKKRNHRGGKKKRSTKQPFALPASEEEDVSAVLETSEDRKTKQSTARSPLQRSTLHRLQGRNSSNTSLESEALLDHREQKFMRPRRSSTLQHNAFDQSIYESPGSIRPQYTNPFASQESGRSRQLKRGYTMPNAEENMDEEADERTPMLATSMPRSGYGGQSMGSGPKPSRYGRNGSSSSDIRKGVSKSTSREVPAPLPSQSSGAYNVNYPPSVPGSPSMSPAHKPMSFGDMLGRDEFPSDRDHFEEEEEDEYHDRGETTPDRRSVHGSLAERLERRPTVAARAEEDVCFPAEAMSEITEIAEEDVAEQEGSIFHQNVRRRRPKWPDLAVLDEWSRIEKEGRSEEARAKRMVEPQLIGGRLRPTHSRNWHRVEEDAPYRFTYFNEEFPSTIHSQTISELEQPGLSFKELFIPDRPELCDSSDDEEDDQYPGLLPSEQYQIRTHSNGNNNMESRATTRQSSYMDLSPCSTVPDDRHSEKASTPAQRGKLSSANTMSIPELSLPPPQDPHAAAAAKEATTEQTSAGTKSPEAPRERPKRYGDRPTWWLDVFSPSEAEMKIIAKTFGIHPLTAEDIMVQEAREKVELFRNYYFVNYRTFEQDMNNEDFLEPVNMYVVVFREGIISFHFSLTPHPANVRRRIRQLKDYLILSSDWISYAIIDDITDVFAPLIQTIEDEVDDIDDAILMLHSPPSGDSTDEKRSEAGGKTVENGADMLRRVGDCRKKVMGLYRLLGNKADVIKGFAKRCNEHWDVAPRSEIGLYLGDIQDHIVTMTGNLSHYEKILARSHGNYLAQINIRMNERQEQTADVLGKLTVLGTIVLPMNIITGLWGMNVWVPGQNAENSLTWFWCITVGLLVFGLSCFLMARTLYRIV
ncbi:CorA metal ion transporter [Pseudogymnoascus verrucosus]|uniref:CorA metal ion transporter n=1 Tax=Pseudogymnoascus verrucosus TaxID=342668 RepID=A0A1B8GJ05_9PEZI|nr:CorA metal ion transporter [Pseudogymnoascus verrucosus]OBT95799.1 CorA metal ion transporter [Pseudogymnoascus verrucosus]